MLSRPSSLSTEAFLRVRACARVTWPQVRFVPGDLIHAAKVGDEERMEVRERRPDDERKGGRRDALKGELDDAQDLGGGEAHHNGLERVRDEEGEGRACKEGVEEGEEGECQHNADREWRAHLASCGGDGDARGVDSWHGCG